MSDNHLIVARLFCGYCWIRTNDLFLMFARWMNPVDSIGGVY